MAYKCSLGAYSFPRTMSVIEDSVQNIVPQQKFARTDGARVIRGSLSRRKIRISGSILGPSSPLGGVANFRTELDNMRNALHANAPAIMFTQYDDRYLVNVSCENIPLLFDSNGYERRARIDLDFIAGDPFYYAVALSNDTWLPVTTGEARAITPGGLESALPTFYITAGVSGASAWTILNNTTGVSFTISGTVVAGDTVVVDCLNQTVTIAGVDRMSYFDGRWISLAANVAADMREAYTGAPTITRIQTQWRNRWI